MLRVSVIITLLVLLASLISWADDHGDSPLAATPIEADGSLITACIEDAGDMDYFLFHAVAGRTYRLSTSHATAEMDCVLYLIAPDGQSIVAVDDNSAGESNALAVWTCTESGVYFAMVRHAQATTGTGCYGLSAAIAQLDDHGNTRLSASPLLDGVTAAGFLEEAGDVDVFMIQVAQGYQYTIHFTSPGDETALSASVYANSATVPLTSLSSRGGTQIETISVVVSEPLFLFIQSDSGEPAGSYILTVEQSGYADDYANSAASATSIPVGWTELEGSLEVPGDVDWFQFDARQGTDYTFTITPAGTSSGQKISIHGPDGALLSESEASASNQSIELPWQVPDTGTYFLEVSSNNGSGAYTLGIASTLKLEAMGAYNPSGYSLDVEVANDLAYLVVGTKGLLIVDVTVPSDPFEIGSHSTNGYAQAVAVNGDTVYIANRSEGVTVIDVSDPTRPVQIGLLDTPGSVHSITVHNDLLLISDQQGGLQIAQIQSGGDLLTLSAVETGGYPAAVAMLDNLALIAVGDAGLEIIDLSNPILPISIGRLDLPGDSSGITVYNNLAYVATGYRGIRVVNLSSPEIPVEVSSISTAGEAIDVLIAGGMLFVAERSEGVSAYSLIDPLAPQLVAQIDTPGEATALSVLNGYIYVADRQEGMLIVRLLQ